MFAKYSGLNDGSPHWQLNRLYLQVLHRAFPDISAEQLARLKMIQGTVALLFDPLDPEGLEALLDLDEGTVQMTLHNLHSMIIVPDTQGLHIQLSHPSVHDFLLDTSHCSDTFVVNSRLQHTLLAQQCLQVLQVLSPDMCKIGNLSLYNQEVADLPNQIAMHIPAHVQYACQHWASHMQSGNIHEIILDLLLSFCSNQLMNWLGVMSLLGDLNAAMTAVKSVHKMVQV
jgi:hypothetical protein